MAASEQTTIDLPGGVRLNVVVSGEPAKPPVLFSNSLGSDLGMWDEVVAALAGEIRAIRYDTRGHGRSVGPDRAYNVEELGRDAIAVLDAVGVERALVCGLSLGGLTAMWLGANAPERVSGLVVANTGAMLPPAALWQDRAATVRAGKLDTLVAPSMERWFTPAFRESRKDVVARGAAMVASTSPGGYAGCCEALAAADLREPIRTITAPTIVVVGDADPSTPPAMGEAIAAAIPGASVATLPAAHLSAMEQPALFASVVRRALKSSVSNA